MPASNVPERVRVHVHGAAQGVGFRPFVYRLASELSLKGWVSNGTQGVVVDIEGDRLRLDQFVDRLQCDSPPHALIQRVDVTRLTPVGYTSFDIAPSDNRGEKTAYILPDIATCEQCLKEIFDPQDRRYLYPFTNCTNCGPRFTIITALPYDRPNTSMRDFALCPDCQQEYDDPANRRFHAQPNACPKCGPQLALWSATGETLGRRHDALLQAADAIRAGAIVAVKGLGGFHLMADARNCDAVHLLRSRKRRDHKPLALMYPSLAAIEQDCFVSDLEVDLLRSAAAPITLIRRRRHATIADAVAPDNPYLGMMLPSTPLHHILLRELNFPVVATSGNRSEEPICTDEYDALDRLAALADLFLVHDRPIARHVDDSIIRVMAGQPQVLRRARGYAPLPVQIQPKSPAGLAVGAHQKNAPAIVVGQDVFIGQHVGDLDTLEALSVFEGAVSDLQTLYDLRPDIVASDGHPDYRSTQFAERMPIPLLRVQHHYAHALSCMADNGIKAPALAVVWDGSGYGGDGSVWGGEFLAVGEQSFERVGHFRQFRLPGGEAAVREPRRAALGVLYETFGAGAFALDTLPLAAFDARERRMLYTMLHKGIHAPLTSSAGRLFDAVAALIGVAQVSSYEGHAACMLEYAASEDYEDSYPLTLIDSHNGRPWVVDWAPTIRGILTDLTQHIPRGDIAAKFLNTLTEAIIQGAQRYEVDTIVLTGGCFQNATLTERAVCRLRALGLSPYWHRDVPPNDGGIALGQLIAAARHVQKDEGCKYVFGDSR